MRDQEEDRRHEVGKGELSMELAAIIHRRKAWSSFCSSQARQGIKDPSGMAEASTRQSQDRGRWAKKQRRFGKSERLQHEALTLRLNQVESFPTSTNFHCRPSKLMCNSVETSHHFGFGSGSEIKLQTCWRGTRFLVIRCCSPSAVDASLLTIEDSSQLPQIE